MISRESWRTMSDEEKLKYLEEVSKEGKENKKE
jgi:hypothetical protein